MVVERSEPVPERVAVELVRVELEVERVEAEWHTLLTRRASWMIVRTSATVTAALVDADVGGEGEGGKGKDR